MRFNLGFDLDEVIVNLTDELEKYLETKYNIYWPAEYFDQYGLMNCTYHSDEEFNKVIQKDLCREVNSPEFQLVAKPFNGAKKALQLFKKAGHKICLITARPKRNEPSTKRWLKQNNIPFDKLIVLEHGEEKGTYGHKLNLDMFVDDLEKHLISMSVHKKFWKKGLLLFDRPWNVNDTRFNRVRGWKEIIDYVENTD
jgi:uncharacterized HAD superfamily protein